MSDETPATSTDRAMIVHAGEDVDYVYRDAFNLYVGAEEVVIEFGNRDRKKPNEMTVKDRVVISVSNAAKLSSALRDTLANMQQVMRQKLEEQRAQAGKEQ